MGFQNQVEAVAELGSRCYREREELRAALAGMVVLLDTLRADRDGRPCHYVESRSKSMVQVTSAIDAARKLLGPNAELTGAAPMHADEQTQPGVRSNDR